MPIFEYRCQRCDSFFETVVLSQREEIACPQCQSNAVDKQLSVFSAPTSGKDADSSAGGCACTSQTCGCR